MAKLNYKLVAEVDPDIAANYAETVFQLLDDRRSVARFVDTETNFQVVFLGENFKYGNDTGLTSGTLTEIRFTTPENTVFATISDLNLKGVKQLEDLLGSEGVDALLAKVLENRDVITGTGGGDILDGEGGGDVINGKAGADSITGDRGNDTMSGGGGNDEFVFLGNSGKDVITDFNVGDDTNFDLIHIRNVTFEMVKFERQLMFQFEDGSSVLLEGVRYADRENVHLDVPV